MPRQSKTYIKILEAALPLFAAYGYKGVAMRDIASAVGITAAALYNHFPNKEQLHLKALEYAFAQKVENLSTSLAETGSAKERLSRFILFWIESFGDNVILRSLLQREMADADPIRMKLLVEHVFQPMFNDVEVFIRQSANGLNPHLLFVSIIGLVMYHFEMSPLRKLIKGYSPEQDEPEQVAKHITELIQHGIALQPENDG
ncbi:MAG: TetR/AcrR family transcriptional regulator [Magnetococcales bacterium]|nr:TetR/AcrR family transcriptional regulator [Magnetococcales bacterium]